ncbi:MAG: inositol monophosphatase family protein [Gemmobacter sp.]
MRHSVSPAEAEDIIAVAAQLAEAGRAATLRHFRRAGLGSDDKGGGKAESRFDPVTDADREAERAMRAILAKRRPRDGVLGEEFAAKVGESPLTWVLDPIDGTRAFLCGAPTWGILIAVSDADGPIYGLIDQPHVGERFEGGLGRALLHGPRGTVPLAARPPRPLTEATVMTTFPEVGSPDEAEAFRAVARRTRLVRYGMDCYAYGLIAAGQIDLVIEAGLAPYDIAAPIAVIEAAGGIVTDWRGRPAHGGGRVLAAANAAVHAEALQILSRWPDPAS